MYLFDIYHQQTKRLREVVKEIIPNADWPESWRTTYLKSYPRFTTIDLPKPVLPNCSLVDCLISRHSHRTFNRQVTIEKISTLLHFSIGEKDSQFDNGVGRRMYPSGGARYPLEFYFVNFENISGLASGVYHYHLEKNGLTMLKKKVFSRDDRLKMSTDSHTLDAQFAIFGTAILSRSAEKYGEKAYRYAQLELGAATQNLSLCAEALGIASINVGGFHDDEIEALLSIDGMDEKVLHAVFFG